MSETRARPYASSPLYSARDRHAAVERRRQGRDAVAYATSLAVAAAVFLIAYDRGSYDQVSRATLAIGVWWAIVLAVALGLGSLARTPRAAVMAGGLLAALAAFTLASTAWADSAERAFLEFDRTALYLGVFVLAVLAGTRGNVDRWADGIALGIAAIGLLALTSRLFPDLVSTEEFRTFLPSAYTRLSYPLGYWNGLAIFTGIGFPLLLRAAMLARNSLLRGLALAPLPALAAVIYLTSSRGGVATALFGTMCFVVLTTRRWSAVAAASIAVLGSIGAVAALQARHELVNEPARAAAESQGRGAALLIAGSCLLAGIVWGAGTALLDGRLPRSVVLDRAAAALVVVAAVVGVAAIQPNERFEEFKQPPGEIESESGDFVGAHLVSANGSGRWQLWESGVEEFETEPLRGRGAGSYEAWWAERGTIEGFVRDAHSLYVELLGELGIVGLLLLVAAFATGIVAGLRRTVGATDHASRATTAALLAGFLAFALGAGVDWMWELTAVAVVGIALLGLLTGPATARAAAREPDPPRRWPLRALPAALALVGLLVVVAQAIPLVASMKIEDSQAAIGHGDGAAALDAALDAKSVQPWAASPYLQLALVEAEVGDSRSALRWIKDAIERDSRDWRLWYTRARIEIRLGRVRAARESIGRARTLNPRSALFARPGVAGS
jgi:hypothetical protein